MKPQNIFWSVATFVILPLCYLAASCESQQQNSSPCDTLSIASGNSNRIIVSNKQAKIVANIIVIEDSAKHVLAYKSKDGWQIVDAEGALEVLIADLESCK